MEITEIIDRLTEMRDAGVTQVLIASQPSWPLAHQVGGVTSLGYEGRVSENGHNDDAAIAWIVAGSHPDDDPYAPGWVFEATGSW